MAMRSPTLVNIINPFDVLKLTQQRLYLPALPSLKLQRSNADKQVCESLGCICESGGMKNNFFNRLKIRALPKKAKVQEQGLSHIYSLAARRLDTSITGKRLIS